MLVDEYQDINELQDEILSLVSHERAEARAGMQANLFCVGDVKQSIYRFRLAEPARFLAREERLRGGDFWGAVIDLQMNFRSRGPLLEAINGVFERLMTVEAADISYGKSHRLIAGQTFPPDQRGAQASAAHRSNCTWSLKCRMTTIAKQTPTMGASRTERNVRRSSSPGGFACSWGNRRVRSPCS